MNRKRTSEAGYSLPEMLTVVAIIGVLALVAVPAFMTFYQSNKVKTSVRNFMGDIRSVRQLSITTDREAKLSFHTGATGTRAYSILQGNAAYNATTWTSVPNRPATKYLDDVVYFPSNTASTPQTFTDVDGDGTIDIICFPDGRVSMPTDQNGTVLTSAVITLKTDQKVYQPKWTVTVSPTGRVSAQ